MRVPHRSRHSRSPLRAGGAAALGLAAAALTGAFVAAPATAATSAAAATSPADGATSPASATSAAGGTPGFTAIRDSLRPTTDKVTGAFTAKRMTVGVALAPRDEAGLNSELSAVYTKGSGHYHEFLAKGQFDNLYAPSAGTTTAVTSYLASHGLTVAKASSPFLLQASGSSAQITSTFRTALSTYMDPRGIRYFANSKPAYVPAALSGAISGVVGLNNTVRLHSLSVRPSGEKPRTSGSCETGYPTSQQIFDRYVAGTSVSLGYGDGPGCSGLTPSQANSIYDAPAASGQTQGGGVTTALFELSAYNSSDARTWTRQFYGPSYSPKVTEKNVDGGPLSTSCPPGDTCVADYSGDVEVDADIEQELSVAPDAGITVYDAPNDQTGRTSLDEYTAIANDDTAATVSSSWGLCESDVGEGYAESENTIFEKMALQGQSVFAAAGDRGAFDCIVSDGSRSAAIDDPGAQPWVISAGGTSLGTDNPGTSAHPRYPAPGAETAWNPDNLCGTAPASASNDEQGGYFWCETTGGGGGGSSKYWGAPGWQKGAGTASKYTTYGSSHCALAKGGSTPCRQVPDVSANADEFTPYAEYCTGTASDTNSTCATIGNGGWFGIGGTSLSAPLWGALIADRDSYQGRRSGNIGSLVYGDPGNYLNDVAAPARSPEKGVTPATNNGLFPTTPGYDEATGLGSPKFAVVIEG
jgi:subtilase family serine protease